jgi:drug/metabolite transporter (DMT)-like permease
VGYGLIAAVMWGLSAVAAAKAARRTGTYLAVLCGQGLGVLSLLALAAVVRPSFAAADGAVALHLAGAGLVGLVGYLCYYRAIEDGPVGLGSAISSTYGGIAALLAVIVLGERLGVIGIAGVVLAVAGVAMAIARATGPAEPAAGPAEPTAAPPTTAAPIAAAPPAAAPAAEQTAPGQSDAGQSDPGQSDPELSDAGQNHLRPTASGQSDAGQSAPGQSDGEQSDGEQGLGLGEPIVGVAPIPGRPRRLSRLAIPLAFASALAYGAGGFLLGDYSGRAGWLGAALIAHGTSVTALLAVLPLMGRRPGAWRGGATGAAWAAAAGLTDAAGLLAFARGGQVGQVAVTAAVSSVYPVIPLAAGLALFGERLRASQLLGVGLVVAGLVLLGLTA